MRFVGWAPQHATFLFAEHSGGDRATPCDAWQGQEEAEDGQRVRKGFRCTQVMGFRGQTSIYAWQESTSGHLGFESMCATAWQRICGWGRLGPESETEDLNET